MKYKKILAVLSALTLAAAPLIACSEAPKENATPTNTDPYDIPQDYCRTYYEVFVRSFSDGNGDGIGDIKGLINNLDYLNDGDDSTTTDLGINGIWMMPINSSPSYHKYDVEDYYNIDDEYGTLEDFDKLVEECNKRDIWLQMDLVLNHTSNNHEWFKQAVADAKSGRRPETSQYMQRYTFVRTDAVPSSGTYYKVDGTPYSYLANFSSVMPDLNLSNTAVREEIEKIVDFWLERGIRSFRLDAVPWACEDSVIYSEANGEFWTWFNDYCNTKGAEVYGKEGDGINSYCYNVGEVWASESVIKEFFGTGMSNFNYGMAEDQPTSGFIQVARNESRYSLAANLVSQVADMQADILTRDPDALLSNFLTNHDNSRSAGTLDYNKVLIKKAASLYMLMPGNPYIYYGEEIGAAGPGGASNTDPNKRLPFNWGDKSKGLTTNPPGVNFAEEFKGNQPLGTWKSQTDDADSVLTYYRNVIKLRNRFPEIGRGAMTAYAINGSGALQKASEVSAGLAPTDSLTKVNFNNKRIAAYTLTWNDSTVLIVQNVGDASAELDISSFDGYDIVGKLCANSNKANASLANGKLNMPAGTVAVLKK